MSSRTALSEACTAVAASIITLYVSYPIEVFNTVRQSEEKSKNEKSNDLEKSNIQRISKVKLFLSMFRGLHLKTAQVTLQSFLYFYIYSYVRDSHKQLVHSRKRTNSPYKPSIPIQLSLSAVSAMMAVLVSLPFESMAARKQVEKGNDEEKETGNQSDLHSDDSVCTLDLTEATAEDSASVSNLSHSDDNDVGSFTAEDRKNIFKIFRERGQDFSDSDGTISTTTRSTSSDSLSSGSEVKKDSDRKIVKVFRNEVESKIWLSERSMNNFSFRRQQQPTVRSTSSKFNVTKFREMWNGLTPSILLTSNPAINFTVYDTLKDALLKYKAARNKHLSLNMPEAFLLGVLSKFAAIIVTYPLIRTKIIMMVAKRNKNNEGMVDDKNYSVTGILKRMYSEGGVKELYKGCGLTLLLTLTRSALFMMAKDGISQIRNNRNLRVK